MKLFGIILFAIVFMYIFGMQFLYSYLIKGEPPNYTEMKDEQGRLKEKYGNENSWDNDADFHSFYYYNKKGQLFKERTYSTDTTYLVKDTTDYIDFFYSYDENGDIEREIKTMRMRDDNYKPFRDTIYIRYPKMDTTIYPNN